MEPTTRIELVTSSLPRMCSTDWATWAYEFIRRTPNSMNPAIIGASRHIFKKSMEWSGKRDSNPRPSAWKADALAPELFPPSKDIEVHLAKVLSISSFWWRGEDSNLRRLRRQIYSLLPLATRVPLQLHHQMLELAMGLEPATCWLQISCSTCWATPADSLTRNGNFFYILQKSGKNLPKTEASNGNSIIKICQQLFFMFLWWKVCTLVQHV